ncbi:extensin-like, partial [Amphibalanus amphitrite]|uniref:extensin-like n=1 Tax=Amphibalanus amphitrite TaxID=1232801 RepID=UPI001C926E44
RCSRSLRAGLLLLTWAGLSTQESADLTPFHGFLPQNKLRALLPPGDPHPNDIYHRSRPKPEPIPPGFEIKYPDYKFTFDIPKDPERPVYIITEKSTEPVIRGHHACDGHGHRATSMLPTVAPPTRPTARPPFRPTVAPPARPTAAPRPAAPLRPPFGRPSPRPAPRPVTPFSAFHRRPVQLTSSATLSRPTPTVFSKPHRSPQPPALLTRSREPVSAPPRQRATTRPVVAKTPSTPSLFDKLKKYPPEQYRVFPGGYARLSTYSSLSG